MTNILRYALSVLIPVGYLIWLVILLSNHPSDMEVRNTTGWAIGLLILTNTLLPPAKLMWSWLCRIPILLMIASWLWFHVRLSPTEDRNGLLIAFVVVFALSIAIGLLEKAYREWWPGLSMVAKVVVTTVGIIISGLAIVYLLSVLLKAADWHDILITNWYVTVLVLYLPVFLGALFIRNALEKRKIERKP